MNAILRDPLEPTRIVIVGDDSGHIPQILEYQKHSALRASGRIVVCAQISSRLNLATELDHVKGPIDGVFLASRNPMERADQASTVLSRSLPVYSDKLLGTDLRTCRELLALARRKGVTASGGSTLRFTKQIRHFSAQSDDATTITVSGGADPKSPYGGLGFYAVHTLDAALALAGPGAKLYSSSTNEQGNWEVIFQGKSRASKASIKNWPNDGTLPFTISHGSRPGQPISLSSDYLFPLIEAWIASLHSQNPLLSEVENLTLAETIEAIQTSSSTVQEELT